MKQHRLMSRITALVLGLAVAVAAMTAASAQQEPPHRFYGGDQMVGATVAVHDAMGEELASATVAEDGTWFVDVDRDAVEGVSFSVDGKSVDAEVVSTGSGQSAVTLTAMAMEEPDGDAMEGDGDAMEGDSMEGDDLDSLEGEDDSMDDGSTDDGAMDDDTVADDSMGDDSMDDGSMEEDSMDDGAMDEGDTEYPGTGSGGLADGGVSAGLIGLLIALSVAAVGGLGLRRVRNRA